MSCSTPALSRDDEISSRAIAVIGMSGRFPGAPTVEALWDLLASGGDAVTEAPSDRPWLRELHDPRPRTPGRVPSDRGGFLPGLDLFDAAFFDMSPREARRTDPQTRLLLEVAYEALEDAGVSVGRLSRLCTGVFIGNTAGDYWLRQLDDLDGLDFYAALGAQVRAAFSGRLAYAFDLHGPTVTVDTACSSSLAAVHLACQSLRAGECDAALAGAANLILTPYEYVTFGQAGSLSPRGRCAFADRSADGYLRSEAVGVVLLKPLAAALAAGDRVRAVILGSAVGNDGFTGSGMAAPSVDGQVTVLRAAYAQAGVDPRDVTYVEAHGTGTPVGDRTELTALSRVLGPRAANAPLCLVGSVKVNVGHSEAAAGIVGLIKTVLCLEYRAVPPTPLPTGLTPAIDWASAPLRLSTDAAPLPDGPVVAGVSSFGITGTNSHMVLSSPSPVRDVDHTDKASPRLGLLAISARSATALRTLAARYADLLESGRRDSSSMGQLCAAAATRREHFERRLAVAAESSHVAAAALRDYLAGHEHVGIFSSPDDGWIRPRVVFVFPGQGSQWQGMGRQLLACAPFGHAMEACDAVIREQAGWSVLDALRDEDAGWLERTVRVQPVLWAMQVAFAQLWHAWGIRPDAVVGHSHGEIAAAHCAGALSLQQSGRLSCLRAALVDRLAPPGGMCWVECAYAAIPGLLDDLAATACIAVVEGPSSTVLSGAVDQIERIVDGCAQRDVPCRRVDVDYAAHSPHIDPIRQPFLDGLADLTPTRTTVPFLSTVTGGELSGPALDGDYWWRNLRQAVRLDQAVRALQGQRPVVFLQMAPHPVLTAALQENASASGIEAMALASSRRGQPEMRCLSQSLAALYAAGVDPDWEQVHGGCGGFVDLPHYPWQRSSHWHQATGYPWPPINSSRQAAGPAPHQEKPTMATAITTPAPVHPWLTAVEPGQPGATELRGGLDRERDEFLLGNRVAGQPIMPGAGFLEMAMAAGSRLVDDSVIELSGIDFREVLPLDDGPWDLLLRVTAQAGEHGWRLGVTSRHTTSDDWTEHAVATLEPGRRNGWPLPAQVMDDIRGRCPEWLAGERFYRAHTGNDWQGFFRGIAEVWRGDAEVLVRVRPIDSAGFCFHPAALDACLQAVAAVLPLATSAGDRGFVLLGADRLRVRRSGPVGALWSHARCGGASGTGVCADVTVLDASGSTVAEINGIRLARLSAPTRSMPAARHGEWWPTVQWREVSAVPVPAQAGHWLLLGGGTDMDDRLSQCLAAAGCTVTTIRDGDSFAADGPGRFRVNPSSDSDLARAVSDAARTESLQGVVSLRALPAVGDAGASTRGAQWTATDLCAGVTRLARALDNGDGDHPARARLFLVTRGAQAAVHQDTCPAPWQAAIWGIGQVLGREQPVLDTVLVDLDERGAGDLAEADDLARVLLAPGQEQQLALRGGRRLAPRLLAGSTPPIESSQHTDVLHTDGGIAGLELRPDRRVNPGPGQVEIQVSHVGLNYRDVLISAGALRGFEDQAAALGVECAGTVSRLGQGVTNLAVGDRVLAIAHPAMRTHLVVDARLVVPKPERLSMAEAACLPIAYCTAYHGLVELARLRPGERVLIHSGTGGVGQAAMEVARWRGAVVYATAGTDAKRHLLRELGAAKVADSRGTRFVERFRDSDQGVDGGVDVVLNTLVGDAVEANFALLNPFGRYIDIAENDIAEGRPLSMAVFSLGRSYLPVDLLALLRRATQRTGELLRTVVGLIERGELAPPTSRVFAAADAAEAFSLMARSGHTGKLALAFVDDQATPAEPDRVAAPDGPHIRTDATYLVTGGLSGVGGLVSRWLLDQGARHLLLTGRAEITPDPTSVDRRAILLAELRSTGAHVEYAAVDIADHNAMAEVVRRRKHDGLPEVRGVVHSATVLDPQPAIDLGEDDLDQALRPKVAGGWALHKLFADRPLDFFVLFSSAVSVLAGLSLAHQLGAYAAANAFLDALCAHRRAAGQPATAVNWGYWADTGLAHRLGQAEGHDVRPTGMLPIRPTDAPNLFAAMVAASGQVICLPANWAAYLTAYPQDADVPLLRDLLAGLRPASPSPATQPAPLSSTTPHLEPSPAPPVREPQPTPPSAPGAAMSDVSALEDWLAEQLARILDVPEEQIDRTRPANKLGLDSLMTAELRDRLRREHGRDLTMRQILGESNVRQLALKIADTPDTRSQW